MIAGEICEAGTGKCICKVNYQGDKCDQCAPGYFGPACQRKYSIEVAYLFNVSTKLKYFGAIQKLHHAEKLVK